MICYMLIMIMPLWITVYLRNKWCLNLESWILHIQKMGASVKDVWGHGKSGLDNVDKRHAKLRTCVECHHYHYDDAIKGAMASQITSLTIVYLTFFRAQIKETSKFRVTGLCAGIHRRPVNSPHKWPVTRKMFPFDDVIMTASNITVYGECGMLPPGVQCVISVECYMNRLYHMPGGIMIKQAYEELN